PHDAEISDEMGLSLLELGPRRASPHLFGFGSDAHDEDAVRRHSSPLDRNLAVRLIGRERDRRGAKRHPLGEANQPVEKILTVELRQVKLRAEVEVVENKAHAEELEEPRNQEHGVRRVPGMEDAETRAKINPQSQAELRRKR